MISYFVHFFEQTQICIPLLICASRSFVSANFSRSHPLIEEHLFYRPQQIYGFSSLLPASLLLLISASTMLHYVSRHRRYSSINSKCTRIPNRAQGGSKTKGMWAKVCKNWRTQLLVSTGLLRFPPRVGEFLPFAEF